MVAMTETLRLNTRRSCGTTWTTRVYRGDTLLYVTPPFPEEWDARKAGLRFVQLLRDHDAELAEQIRSESDRIDDVHRSYKE